MSISKNENSNKIILYRFVSLWLAIIFPIYAFGYEAFQPNLNDPIILRIINPIIALIVFILSFNNYFKSNYLEKAMVIIVYSISIWLFIVNMINYFPEDLVLEFLIAIILLSNIFFNNYRKLIIYLGSISVITCIGVLVTPYTDINKCLFFLLFTTVPSTSYFITTRRIKAEKQIIYLAYYDVLTDLPNKRLGIDKLQLAIDKASIENHIVGVVFIDLDKFKYINDTLGHAVGDVLLIDVAKRLKNYVREKDIAVRLGGDEFLIIIEKVHSLKDLPDILDRITNAFSEPFTIEGKNFNITCSAGISTFPEHGTDVDTLLKNSDIAMYKAKQLGKNNYQFFKKSMEDEIDIKMNMEESLRDALKNKEFTLCYQPQIETRTGRFRGYEVLIRWKNNEMGIISPQYFIPVAEETGLIVPIGEWVLRTACKKHKEWQELYSTKLIVSVNVSAVQLKQNDFVDIVRDILRETELDPELLELEITESILIESFDTAITILEQLRNLGVKVSLDDFGTGYSSLSYLKNFPCDTLKIDKSFIKDIKLDSSKNSFVGSIISLVHQLDLEIVAEGVETKEQLDYLLHNKCNIVQGYLLSKPVTDKEILNIFKNEYFDLTKLTNTKI